MKFCYAAATGIGSLGFLLFLPQRGALIPYIIHRLFAPFTLRPTPTPTNENLTLESSLRCSDLGLSCARCEGTSTGGPRVNGLSGPSLAEDELKEADESMINMTQVRREHVEIGGFSQKMLSRES